VSATASARAAPAVVPTAITKLPVPKCKNAKVLELYAAALQDMHDANWDHAKERLREAVGIEPACAAAEMRLAMIGDAPERQPAYQRAVEHRADLDLRDQMILDAINPVFDVKDRSAEAAKALAAAHTFPGDAELWGTACSTEGDAKAAAPLCRRALDLDPDYADVWQTLATKEAGLGQPSEQMKALDRCIEVSSTSVDCRRERSDLRWKLGECDGSLGDLKAAIDMNPRSVDLRSAWIQRLDSRDKPYELILEAEKKKWELLERDRDITELNDRFDLAITKGRYAETRRLRTELGKRLDRGDVPPELAAKIMRREIEYLLQIGRTAEAADAAERYLRRLEAWSELQLVQLQSVEAWTALWKAGRMSKAERDRNIEGARRGLTAIFSQILPPNEAAWAVWRFTLPPVLEEDEARAAVATAPARPVPVQARTPFAEMEIAAGEVAAGLADMTLGPCNVLEPSTLHAFALAETGRKDDACTEYAALIARREKGAPPSTLAKRFLERLDALHCPGLPPH
jgi:tetratricopeptide (TPR) repeat protein